jgi:biopolymer transport protein ExbD
MAVKINKGTVMMQIPVIPLVDTVFNLLIFFLVATKIAEADRELPLDPPVASEAVPMIVTPREVVINIDAQTANPKGRYLYVVGSETLNLSQLDAHLKAAVAVNPANPPSAVIRADRRCVWEAVAAAMNSCKKAKIREYRATTRDPTESVGKSG